MLADCVEKKENPMGDAPGIALLSAIPLLVIIISVAAAAIAWRSRKRAARTAVAVILIVIGAATIFPAIGMLFSVGASALIIVLGIVLLIGEYGMKRSAR
jgi:hypothetical protein